MNQGRGACLWTSVPQQCPAPCDRYKHASCAYRDHVYILGGREQCSLRDFWKYNVVCDKWAQLPYDSEEAPEELEEHTMVAYQGFMYVFGGMQDSSYTNSKTPLWVFDTGIFYSVHVQWGSKMSESTRQCFNKKFYVL
ncbi:hypothetical protein cypCar_00008866 [Cyprinus carpio]|nr:hypothetical protein cypCar_00008866 [Cyprinus carpio]